jgi:hypothetical protein
VSLAAVALQNTLTVSGAHTAPTALATVGGFEDEHNQQRYPHQRSIHMPSVQKCTQCVQQALLCVQFAWQCSLHGNVCVVQHPAALLRLGHVASLITQVGMLLGAFSTSRFFSFLFVSFHEPYAVHSSEERREESGALTCFVASLKYKLRSTNSVQMLHRIGVLGRSKVKVR